LLGLTAGVVVLSSPWGRHGGGGVVIERCFEYCITSSTVLLLRTVVDAIKEPYERVREKRSVKYSVLCVKGMPNWGCPLCITMHHHCITMHHHCITHGLCRKCTAPPVGYEKVLQGIKRYHWVLKLGETPLPYWQPNFGHAPPQ
jgi:hypothetical protein